MEHRFQVNLKGVISLLSENIYSGPKVYLRELLQNSLDAVKARELFDPNYSGGRITIEINDGDVPTLILQDNGIGLNEDEVHQFLATIGESSKRDALGKARADFIGQFGIGLLSCFMVAEEIVVISQSAKPDAVAVEWRGRQNGTYSVRAIHAQVETGTRVYLRGKREMRQWLSSSRVRELAELFGSLLTVPILVGTGVHQVRINSDMPPWRQKQGTSEARRAAMLEYGQSVFGATFIDAIPLKSATGDIDGMALVLPYSPSPSAKSQHRVYLRNMLLSESAEGILPDWAFFVRCIVNSNDLRPTASREAFYEDTMLEEARQELGNCLREYLVRLSRENPDQLTRIIEVHHLAIKALATHDLEFCGIFLDWLPFETSSGTMTLGEYRRLHKKIRFVPTVSQFKQVARVAAAQQICVINAGYTYDRDLLRNAQHIFEDTIVEEVDIALLSGSFEALSLEERTGCFSLLRAGDVALQPFRCGCDVVRFEPVELATLYNTSRDAILFRSAEQTRELADEHWAGLLDNVVGTPAVPYARLFLNYNNPLIQRLAAMRDQATQRRCVEMLYVQSLLLGMHPLSSRELSLLNDGLMNLIESAVTEKPERK